MFIMSGVSHFLISNQPQFYSAAHAFPINNISNVSDESLRQTLIDSNIKQTSIDTSDAHELAYSAYAHRRKRTATVSRYSEADCQKASSELASLVSISVSNPGTWDQFKRRIQALQSITKSADCKA